MAAQPTFTALQAFYEVFTGADMRKQASHTLDAAPLSRAKLAPRPAAAAPPAADAWAIPAVQHLGSVCTDDAGHQEDCMDLAAYTDAPAAEPEGSADVSAAAAAPLPTLDLELTAEEAQWLVQPPALPHTFTPTSIPAPEAQQPTSTTAHTSSQQASPNPSRPAAAPLAALRRGLRRLAGGLRRRLAAAACLARPATLECGGCPGRRLGNASSGASAEWTVVHVNWT